MTPDAKRALRAELGAAPPKGLDALSDDEIADLAAALREARSRDKAALAKAMQDSLQHIPRLLRGPVRKMIG
jgi:predicted DNA-binding transcriptional regulator YafY